MQCRVLLMLMVSSDGLNSIKIIGGARSHVEANKRGMCLGCPPQLFTTNASESVNAILKNKVNYKKTELPLFISPSAF